MGRNSGKRAQEKTQNSRARKKHRGNKEQRRALRSELRSSIKAGKKARKLVKDDDDELAIEKKTDQILETNKVQLERLTHESFGRRRAQKRSLLKKQLKSSIDEDEERLVCWYPGKEEFLENKEKQRKRFDPEKLRGFARPAEEAYPDLFPDYHAEKERKDLEEREQDLKKGDDYLAKYDKHWGNNEQTRALLGKYIELALLIFEGASRGLGDKTKNALKKFEKITEMDSDKYLALRVTWFKTACLIDLGDLGLARKEIQDNIKSDDAFSAMLLWDLVLINFIGRRVLEEEDTTEEELQTSFEAAMAVNPYISKCLMLHNKYAKVINQESVDAKIHYDLKKTMDDFIESNDQPKVPGWNLEEQSIIYFVRSISWWRDAGDEIFEFVGDYVRENADSLADFEYETPFHSPLVKMYDKVSFDDDDEEESSEEESSEEESFIQDIKKQDSESDDSDDSDSSSE